MTRIARDISGIVAGLLIALTARAQTVTLSHLDASGFPRIAARLSVLDADGSPVSGLSTSDLELSENGTPIDAITLSCSPPSAPTPFNAVLVVDRSGSMKSAVTVDQTRFDIVRDGVEAFIDAVDFSGGSRVAVTSFNESSSIERDFTSDAVALRQAVDGITLAGGTDYNPPLLNSLTGAIAMLAGQRASSRRVVVFLTDGKSGAATDVDAIVAAASAASVHVYVVTIGTPVNKDLRDIADATGGDWYERVHDASVMQAVYRDIAARAGGATPCQISWVAPYGCTLDQVERNVRLRVVPLDAVGLASYQAPPTAIVALEASPSPVWFGPVVPPATAQRTVTLTARNGPFTITGSDITAGTPFSVVDWGGSPPPISLSQDESRTITIEFAPGDSLVHGARLALAGDPCDAQNVELVGGTTPPGVHAQLEVTSPDSGDVFSGCQPVVITWRGVAPDVPVTVDVSSDGGGSWDTIGVQVTGLSMPWSPPSDFDSLLVRVSTGLLGEPFIRLVAGGGLRDDEGAPLAQSLFITPTAVAPSGTILYAAEQGIDRIRVIDRLLERTTELPVSGMTAPTDVLMRNDTLFIADRDAHQVFIWNRSTGAFTILAGTGQSGFRGDGGDARQAWLQYPVALAASGRYLYVSDQGNNAIRRIDLGVNPPVISTFAGRGASAADDVLARDAELRVPGGIAIDNDTMYVVERNVRLGTTDGANLVRRIDMQSGLIRTIAGTGASGFSGDGGSALNATFDDPVGVAVVGDDVFVSDVGNHRIRQIDRRSGVITTLAGTGQSVSAGDGGPARLAQLQRPWLLESDSDRIYVPDAAGDRIREILLPAAAVDVGGPFAVHSARLRTVDRVDMGVIAVGAARDSAVTAFACNDGAASGWIDTAWTIGPDASEFTPVSGIPSTSIDPTQCHVVEIRFAPAATGMRSARLVVQDACGSRDTTQLSGIGIDPCGVETLSTIAFEPTAVSASRDSVVVASLCNHGSGELRGTASIQGGGGAFSIVAGGGPFILAPGGCLDVTLRFAPADVGRISARLDFGIASECAATPTQLYGVGLDQPLVVLDTLRLDTMLCQDVIDSVLTLVNHDSVPLEVTGATIVSNGEGFELLTPVPSNAAPLTIQPGGLDTGRIGIRLAPAARGSKRAVIDLATSRGIARWTVFGYRDSIGLEADRLLLLPDRPDVVYPRDTFAVVKNTGTLPLAIISAGFTPVDGRVSVLSGQLPLNIAPDQEIHLAIRISGPPSGGFYDGVLRLAFTPHCSEATIDVPLREVDRTPEITIDDLTFEPIRCSESERDTVVSITNTGGSDLIIMDAAVMGDADGSFSVAIPTPTTIVPGQTATFPARYAPSADGASTASLELTTNASGGTSTIALSGVRLHTDYELSDDVVEFGYVDAGVTATRTVTVTNTGTSNVTLNIPPASVPFAIQPSGQVDVSVGSSLVLTMTFTATPVGESRQTLTLTDTTCGISRPLGLHGVRDERIGVVATFPDDSAVANTNVRIPITIASDDTVAMAGLLPQPWTVEMLVDASVLDVRSVEGATIIGDVVDSTSAMRRIRIEGTYDGSHPGELAALECRSVSGPRFETPLLFSGFAMRSDLFDVDTNNGSFTIIGNCFERGLWLASRPHIEKVIPNPSSNRTTLRLFLADWLHVRVSILDVAGVTRTLIADRLLTAGRHEIDLDLDGVPSGTYTLIVDSPYGSDATPLVVVQ